MGSHKLTHTHTTSNANGQYSRCAFSVNIALWCYQYAHKQLILVICIIGIHVIAFHTVLRYFAFPVIFIRTKILLCGVFRSHQLLHFHHQYCAVFSTDMMSVGWCLKLMKNQYLSLSLTHNSFYIKSSLNYMIPAIKSYPIKHLLCSPTYKINFFALAKILCS